jgi:hypothetical protein
MNVKVRLIIRRGYGFHSATAALALVMLACDPINLTLPHETHLQPAARPTQLELPQNIATERRHRAPQIPRHFASSALLARIRILEKSVRAGTVVVRVVLCSNAN